MKNLEQKYSSNVSAYSSSSDKCHDDQETNSMSTSHDLETELSVDSGKKKSFCTSADRFPPYKIDGDRIVDYSHVIVDILNKAYDEEGRHKAWCTRKRWELVGSSQKCKTIATLYCRTCRVANTHKSHPDNAPNRIDIDKALVFGAMTSGSGYSNLQQLLAPVGIPFMSAMSYMKHQQEIIRDILGTSAEKLNKNNQEEKRRAKENGYFIFVVDVEGTIFLVVWTTVISDASWLQRTYPGGAYDSFAGTAVIIGTETNKPLAFVVKCKACAVCDRGGEVVKDHYCYKNFDRSRGSGSKYIVADGASSVMCGILNADAYSQFGITVMKFTCVNHKLKNHGKAIDKIAAKPKQNKEVTHTHTERLASWWEAVN